MSANARREPTSDSSQLAVHNTAYTRGILNPILLEKNFNVCQSRRDTNRISSVCACHRAWRVKIHNFTAAHQGRNGERTADSLSKTGQVGNDFVMFESKELAGPTESCLNFVEDQESLVGIAPSSQFLDILFGSQTRSSTLVGF